MKARRRPAVAPEVVDLYRRAGDDAFHRRLVATIPLENATSRLAM